MKLCKDCAHFEDGDNLGTTCSRKVPCPVWGIRRNWYACSTERGENSLCGMDAKYFEERNKSTFLSFWGKSWK